MIYSKTCEYAIRALIYFAESPEKEYATVRDVSQASGVPQAYVAKIFQCLTHANILRSRRGASGGYFLAMPVGDLTLLRIIQSLDDLTKSPFSNCIMGFDKCNDRNPCPLHPVWAKAKEKMLERLADTSIADVAALGDRFRKGRQRRRVLSKRMREMFTV